MLSRKTTLLSALVCGVSCVCASGAVCFRLVQLGDSCSIATPCANPCQGTATNVGEPVTTTETVENNGGRRDQVQINFVCLQVFTTRNEHGVCGVLTECQVLVSGFRLSGMHCPIIKDPA